MDNITDDQIQELEEQIISGEVTEEYIEKTKDRLGDDIAQVYGFDISYDCNKCPNWDIC